VVFHNYDVAVGVCNSILGEKGEGRVNSNIEYRILNGEAEIGGVLRGGWFNRFLDKPAAAGKLGMTRTGDGNLALEAG